MFCCKNTYVFANGILFYALLVALGNRIYASSYVSKFWKSVNFPGPIECGRSFPYLVFWGRTSSCFPKFEVHWYCRSKILKRKVPVYHQLPEFTQTHVHRVGDAVQPSHPLSSPSPPAPNPSQHQGLFQWVNSSHEVAKVWSFSFSISPSNEHPGLISFRMDWLDLLAVQGTLKSLLQYHTSKASILQHSAFFTVQISHPYMTTGKTIALTKQTLCWQSNVSAF